MSCPFCHWNRYAVAAVFCPVESNLTGPCTELNVPAWSFWMSFALSRLLLAVTACAITSRAGPDSSSSQSARAQDHGINQVNHIWTELIETAQKEGAKEVKFEFGVERKW